MKNSQPIVPRRPLFYDFGYVNIDMPVEDNYQPKSDRYLIEILEIRYPLLNRNPLAFRKTPEEKAKLKKYKLEWREAQRRSELDGIHQLN